MEAMCVTVWVMVISSNPSNGYRTYFRALGMFCLQNVSMFILYTAAAHRPVAKLCSNVSCVLTSLQTSCASNDNHSYTPPTPQCHPFLDWHTCHMWLFHICHMWVSSYLCMWKWDEQAVAYVNKCEKYHSSIPSEMKSKHTSKFKLPPFSDLMLNTEENDIWLSCRAHLHMARCFI